METKIKSLETQVIKNPLTGGTMTIEELENLVLVREELEQVRKDANRAESLGNRVENLEEEVFQLVSRNLLLSRKTQSRIKKPKFLDSRLLSVNTLLKFYISKNLTLMQS